VIGRATNQDADIHASIWEWASAPLARSSVKETVGHSFIGTSPTRTCVWAGHPKVAGPHTSISVTTTCFYCASGGWWNPLCSCSSSNSSAAVTPAGRSMVIFGPVNHFFAETCQPIHSASSVPPTTIGV